MLKGSKHSEEVKKRMSKSHEGNKSMVGRHLSEEWKSNISKGGLGLKRPERSNDWKRKIGLYRRGKKASLETKKKMSESHKGHHVSDYTKQRMIEYNKNRVFSSETRNKMREAKKGKFLGNNNPNWKDGRAPLNHKIRTSSEMKLWKKACLEKDNFTCAKTGQIGGKLEIHHINNFASFPELRTSIQNGITLSKESHIAFHKQYGKINNTKEQLEEFLGYKLV